MEAFVLIGWFRSLQIDYLALAWILYGYLGISIGCYFIFRGKRNIYSRKTSYKYIDWYNSLLSS